MSYWTHYGSESYEYVGLYKSAGNLRKYKMH